MKKIFTIEINEKDKNFEDKEIVERINKLINDFGMELNNETDVYIKFKRVGAIWDNIVSESQKNNSLEKMKLSKLKSHLKLIK